MADGGEPDAAVFLQALSRCRPDERFENKDFVTFALQKLIGLQELFVAWQGVMTGSFLRFAIALAGPQRVQRHA